MSRPAECKRLIVGALSIGLLAAGYALGRHVGVQAIFVSPLFVFALSWALLAGIEFPKAHWAALRAGAPSVFFLSQLPYLGFLLLPVEIAASGALLGNRKELPLWKAMSAMAMVRVLVIASLQPWYLMDLLAW